MTPKSTEAGEEVIRASSELILGDRDTSIHFIRKLLLIPRNDSFMQLIPQQTANGKGQRLSEEGPGYLAVTRLQAVSQLQKKDDGKLFHCRNRYLRIKIVDALNQHYGIFAAYLYLEIF